MTKIGALSYLARDMVEHTPATIIPAAERYCAAAGIKLSTLGYYAVGNTRLFANLAAGRPCLTSTLARVDRYMREHPVSASNTPGSDPIMPSLETVNALQPAEVAAE